MSPTRTDIPSGHVAVALNITDHDGTVLALTGTLPVGLVATMLADQAQRMRQTDTAAQPTAAPADPAAKPTEAEGKPKVHGVGEAEVSEPTTTATTTRRGAGFTL